MTVAVAVAVAVAEQPVVLSDSQPARHDPIFRHRKRPYSGTPRPPQNSQERAVQPLN